MTTDRYGPKVTWQQIVPGVRVYYTGDMANPSGAGVITKAWHDAKWDYRHICMTLEDDRKIQVTLANFQPGPGRRFWLEADWLAKRERDIEQMKAEFDALMARRAAAKTAQ